MAPTAHWTAKEELALVDFLIVHQAEASDGANFKVVTFQKAAKHLTPMLERGATKNVKSRENKYCAVFICAIQLVSCWTLDDETGATINIRTTSSWDDYVKVHPKAKPFHNKGWPHFHKMETLMPATVAGVNVYHASVRNRPKSEPLMHLRVRRRCGGGHGEG
ncbi:hypothetical protein K443DRAFT_109054 [Laccaria amethystina LaAM-08-1]|uniref:Myb/SANT-like domain-containing protein n=1 Tax=Laccaria amethystina LaAM-08-1 TaxID=1095629 RepID=A0A0C9WJT9_9AGAR|nr:hypothetical protein K443DRAFT_109054 [Laccaria amethystina LaAM-08-1]